MIYYMRNKKSNNEWNKNWLSLIAPKFAYEYDLYNKKYKLYKLKKGLRVNNKNVNNSKNFYYIWDFNSFEWLDKKHLIEIFKSEYNDWFTNRLNFLYRKKNWIHSWFDINEQIVLKICVSFPETFYKLQNPKNICKGNSENFKKWCELLWINEDLVADFYSNVRCELYHFWSIKWNWCIDYEEKENNSEVIYKKWELNCINLKELIKRIKKNMDDYILKLKKNNMLYDLFFENYVKDLDKYLN